MVAQNLTIRTMTTVNIVQILVSHHSFNLNFALIFRLDVQILGQALPIAFGQN